MKKIKINLNKISQKENSVIVDFLKRGKVIVYPTDTIYGLGCMATNKKAINRIFKIKKQEKKKPLLILISGLPMLEKYCKIDNRQKIYLKKLWSLKSPDPLYQGGKPITVILNSKKILPKELTGKKDTLAVRLPKNNFLISLIKKIKYPIVSTSANLSGKEYTGNIEKISELFNKKIDLIVDVGKLKNKPSRIIDITNIKDIKILRK